MIWSVIENLVKAHLEAFNSRDLDALMARNSPKCSPERWAASCRPSRSST